jgi:hypothetical protein
MKTDEESGIFEGPIDQARREPICHTLEVQLLVHSLKALRARLGRAYSAFPLITGLRRPVTTRGGVKVGRCLRRERGTKDAPTLPAP